MKTFAVDSDSANIDIEVSLVMLSSAYIRR